MAMKNFVANGQVYFIRKGTDGQTRLKLGTYTGKNQHKDIAEMKRAKEYPFTFNNKIVLLEVCGEEIPVSEMTDLEIYLRLLEFGTQILW